VEVIPAVDVLDGRVVRLVRGEFSRATVYDQDPVKVAARWMSRGAALVHVVDLDGARTGNPEAGLADRLAKAGVRFQLGGGIRDGVVGAAMLGAGAARVVVGTAALAEGGLDELLEFVDPERVVVALDVRGDEAFGSGWMGRGQEIDDVIANVVQSGIPRVLVTAIARDGAMTGPDLSLLDLVRRQAPDLAVIASGGVGVLDDVAGLAETGVEGVIVGRALYEGRFTLEDAIGAVQ
jgi:phosphoribosylformimino-5-aminoimidazole carboxamide ribotide isomerase